MSERDTHFANFAKILFQEMLDLHDRGYIDVSDDAMDKEWNDEYRQLIARRAYDLVYAACESIDDRQSNYEARITLESMIDNAPDMTAFPTPD